MRIEEFDHLLVMKEKLKIAMASDLPVGWWEDMNDKLAVVSHIGNISTDIVKSIPLNFPKIIYTPPKLFFYIITLCIIFLYIFSWNNPRLGSVFFSYNG